MFYFILCCITKEVTSVVLVGRRFYIRVYGGLNKNVLITKPIYLRGRYTKRRIVREMGWSPRIRETRESSANLHFSQYPVARVSSIKLHMFIRRAYLCLTPDYPTHTHA